MQLPKAKTIIEPFKIKMVEPLHQLTASERKAALNAAHENLFALPAASVTFDLLTDSGTSAMSASQWSAMMTADESYAGASSFYRFEKVIQELTGFPHVVPTHQGRSAEYLLMRAALKPGQYVAGNTHFDTTRANIESSGAKAIDLPCVEVMDSASSAPFKGNMDVERLGAFLRQHDGQVAFVITTVTNNSVGGLPVSLENVRQTSAVCREFRVPLFIDCARFAENAYFIKLHEPGQNGRSIREIARELFSYGDGTLMSAKKDAFGNIGGFLAVKDGGIAEEVRRLMVITEGFPTYGGLAGRDLEALAVGLDEVLDENYLAYRIRSVEYFGRSLEQLGYPTVKPWGGHAVYIDAGKALPHIPALQYPGQALSVALYEHIGIRSVEVGTVMLGHVDPVSGVETPALKELVRLAMPRRVYTQSHVDYMIEMAGHLHKFLPELRGFKITRQPRYLRHFTCHFERL
jgi:tyrosine phenol-lyase